MRRSKFAGPWRRPGLRSRRRRARRPPAGHGLILNRWMTVKASDSSTNDIKAYTVNETAQWVSLWRHLSFNTRTYWGLGGAMDREILHDLAAGTSVPHDERVLGLVAGVDTRRT